MAYSFCLLTATWLAGAPQAPAPPAHGQPRAVLAQPVTVAPAPRLTPVPAAVPEEPARSWRFGDRIRSLFSRRTPEAPPRVDPQVIQTGRTQQVTAAQPAPGNEQFPLSAKELEMVGHEKDHSWLTGKLFRAGNRWVLRYGAPYEVDRYGGAVVLSQHPDLANLKAGDLICVHGRPADGGNARAGSTVYQVESVGVIGRPNGK
jgi:hypothetical protein